MHIFEFGHGPNLFIGDDTWQHVIERHGHQFKMKEAKIWEQLSRAIKDPGAIYRRNEKEIAVVRLYRPVPKKWILVHCKVDEKGGYIKTAHPFTDPGKVSIIREGVIEWPMSSQKSSGASRGLST